VDVPGEALSTSSLRACPSLSPTYPLIEARIENIEAHAAMPSADFSLPESHP